MANKYILFTRTGSPKTPEVIKKKIDEFGKGKKGYKNVVHRTIQDSQSLDVNGEVFTRCANRILVNFKMTRGGLFKEKNMRIRILKNCWIEVGNRIVVIHNSVIESGLSRDRYLLELNENSRNELVSEIWLITKQILQFTMSENSYGLIGASKILFSVLPEIVLPVDSVQWTGVFKTVDLGDIIRQMTSEIQLWENRTGKKLNELDDSGRLTTLPSVYNVMAMDARPKKKSSKVVK